MSYQIPLYRFLSVVIFVGWALGSYAEAAQPVNVTRMDVDFIVNTEANVRDYPAVSGRKLGRLPAGKRIIVTGRTKGSGGVWYRTRFGGADGYIFGPTVRQAPGAASVRPTPPVASGRGNILGKWLGSFSIPSSCSVGSFSPGTLKLCVRFTRDASGTLEGHIDYDRKSVASDCGYWKLKGTAQADRLVFWPNKDSAENGSFKFTMRGNDRMEGTYTMAQKCGTWKAELNRVR